MFAERITVSAAVIVCRLFCAILRLAGRGGTTFPGYAALKICPDLLEKLASGVDIIAVTGTNGKTTTARIIEQALKNSAGGGVHSCQQIRCKSYVRNNHRVCSSRRTYRTRQM